MLEFIDPANLFGLGIDLSWFGVDTFFFLVAALITVAAAIMVVYSEEVVHSAFYLSLVFAGVAVIFFFLNAEYMAIIQLMVYVGAITIMFAFSIMLTRRKIMEDDCDV
jgi:NADH-quinone oxidoreductase subunit J